MPKKYKKQYIQVFSLDELRERASQTGDAVPFEYEVGAYYELDTVTIGEIAHIKKLIKTVVY
jgi:hypothetical protein